MSKDKKSMDDVLASIRRIIKTDPAAAAPDASTVPPGLGFGDETAKAVLDKLRNAEEENLGTPLSTSDDPEETARAVLEELRRQAESGGAKGAKGPDPEEPLKEPTAAAADADDVPDRDDTIELDPDDAEMPDVGKAKSGAALKLVEPDQPAAPARLQKAATPAGRKEPPVMIDEAALEDMIRRVVRDELMGEMGRRMTKNVQKLIQHEVARNRIEKK